MNKQTLSSMRPEFLVEGGRMRVAENEANAKRNNISVSISQEVEQAPERLHRLLLRIGERQGHSITTRTAATTGGVGRDAEEDAA